MTAPTAPTVLAPDTIRKLNELATRFTDVGAAERANYSLYLIELCEAIGVERPRPAATPGRSAEGIAYQFEFPVKTTTRDGVVSTNFIDLYKSGSFALEAKDAMDGSSMTTLLTKAFGQVSNYAKDLAERPPYIMVLDVGKTLIVWDRWPGLSLRTHRRRDANPNRVRGVRTQRLTVADGVLADPVWVEPLLRRPPSINDETTWRYTRNGVVRDDG